MYNKGIWNYFIDYLKMKIDAKILKIDFKFNTHSRSILNPF